MSHKLIFILSPRPMNTRKLQYPANSDLQVWQVIQVGALFPGLWLTSLCSISLAAYWLDYYNKNQTAYGPAYIDLMNFATDLEFIIINTLHYIVLMLPSTISNSHSLAIDHRPPGVRLPILQHCITTRL